MNATSFPLNAVFPNTVFLPTSSRISKITNSNLSQNWDQGQIISNLLDLVRSGLAYPILSMKINDPDPIIYLGKMSLGKTVFGKTRILPLLSTVRHLPSNA